MSKHKASTLGFACCPLDPRQSIWCFKISHISTRWLNMHDGVGRTNIAFVDLVLWLSITLEADDSASGSAGISPEHEFIFAAPSVNPQLIIDVHTAHLRTRNAVLWRKEAARLSYSAVPCKGSLDELPSISITQRTTCRYTTTFARTQLWHCSSASSYGNLTRFLDCRLPTRQAVHETDHSSAERYPITTQIS